MIVHMCKLQIVTLDEQFERLIAGLQGLGYLHLEPVPLEQPRRASRLHRMEITADEERRRQVLAEARRHLEELRALLGELPEPDAGDAAAWQARSAEGLRDAAEELVRKVRSLRRRRRNLEQDRRILQRYLRVGHLVPQAGPQDAATAVLMFTFPSAERLVAKTLRERLRNLRPSAPRLRLLRVPGGHSLAAVACAADRMAEVRELAWRSGTLEFKLPAAYRAEHLAESFQRIESDLAAMLRQLAELDQQLEGLRVEAGQGAATLALLCSAETQRLEAKRNFIESSLLRVLHAYLPVDRREEVLRVVAEFTENCFEVDELSLGPRLEDVPVVLRNPAFAKPFEVLLRVFPPPTYGTFDPTVVNAVGVPIFFGLIVGDLAYGAILLALAGWLRRRSVHRETLRAIGTIGIYCAISTILFGFLYGEFLGSLGPRLGLPALIRREDPQALRLLLKIAIGVGVGHVALGLALGLVTARQTLDRHAFRERLGQLFCLGGAVCFVLGLFAGKLWFLASLACLAVGVTALLAGAGVVGLLEVFSLFSNILSYSRLMALGIASVVLALVANRLFSELGAGLVGLLVAVPLHALNVVIAMFSPTIHTLRLHYVEFFTKFYRPAGRSYVPFGGRTRVPS